MPYPNRFLAVILASCGLWLGGLGWLSAAGAEPETAAADVRTVLLRQCDELEKEMAAAAGGFRRPTVAGALPVASASVEEAQLALALLQVGKARDWLTSGGPDLASAQQALAAARQLLAAPVGPAPAQLVRHGELVEQAYFAANDGSAQPYFLYRPTNYQADGQHPLVVFLHGYVPDTSRTRPYLVSDFVLELANQRNALLVIPHGRTNTDFQYAGEVDVLRVIAEVAAFHAVDASRVYLLGVSMGGAGAWHLSTHYPDRFAAVAQINGQGDWFKFWHELFRYPARSELPSHLEFLFALNNPLDLAGNLHRLYSYSQHATRCFVGVGHSQAMAAALAKVGAPHDFFEDPSDLGHYIYWRPDCWQRAFEKLFEHRRDEAPPRHLRYATYSLRFPGTHWCAIDRIGKWGQLASFEAWFDDQGVRLDSVNADRLILTLPPAWLAADGTVAIAWNGGEAKRHTPDAGGRIRLSAPPPEERRPPAAAGFEKSTAVCGPAADLFNFPFLIVRGTAGGPAAVERNQALATQIANDWYEYAEGRATIVDDQQVDEAMIQNFGLLLVGWPEENRLLERIADKLPLRLRGDHLALPDGQRFPKADTGVILTHPNPLAPQRYALVYAGLPWGAGRSRNHKFDCIPDFAIFTAETVPPIGHNHYLAAGLFDADWRYAPELTDFPVPAPPTTPPPPPEPAPVP